MTKEYSNTMKGISGEIREKKKKKWKTYLFENSRVYKILEPKKEFYFVKIEKQSHSLLSMVSPSTFQSILL